MRAIFVQDSDKHAVIWEAFYIWETERERERERERKKTHYPHALPTAADLIC